MTRTAAADTHASQKADDRRCAPTETAPEKAARRSGSALATVGRALLFSVVFAAVLAATAYGFYWHMYRRHGAAIETTQRVLRSVDEIYQTRVREAFGKISAAGEGAPADEGTPADEGADDAALRFVKTKLDAAQAVLDLAHGAASISVGAAKVLADMGEKQLAKKQQQVK